MSNNFLYPSAIKFVALSNYITFDPTNLETATIKPVSSDRVKVIDFNKGSAILSIEGRKSNSGMAWTSDLRFSASGHIPYDIPGVMIIEFCAADTIIIGSEFHPVIIEGTRTNEREAIQISHEGPTKPKKVELIE